MSCQMALVCERSSAHPRGIERGVGEAWHRGCHPIPIQYSRIRDVVSMHSRGGVGGFDCLGPPISDAKQGVFYVYPMQTEEVGTLSRLQW